MRFSSSLFKQDDDVTWIVRSADSIARPKPSQVAARHVSRLGMVSRLSRRLLRGGANGAHERQNRGET